MKDILVDSNGEHRCANCKGKNFTLKRTRRSKVAVGVGTFATKKKKQCQDCGEYNKLGSAVPYDDRPEATPSQVAAVVDHDAVWRKYTGGWRCVAHKMTVCDKCPPRDAD